MATWEQLTGVQQRAELILQALGLTGVPYDEVTYQALTQLADEMQRWNGIAIYTPTPDTAEDRAALREAA